MPTQDFYNIEERYDAFHDTNGDAAAPRVTWAEKALFDEIVRLRERVTHLETQYVIAPEPDSQMDTAASAVEMAQSLGIDDAVRVVAKSGKNHDHGPNWHAEWGGMEFSATFGAGTNSARVDVKQYSTGDGCVSPLSNQQLYAAKEFGRHIETFRAGPWVNRLLARAAELRQAQAAKAQEREDAETARKLVNFKEVDF